MRKQSFSQELLRIYQNWFFLGYSTFELTQELYLNDKQVWSLPQKKTFHNCIQFLCSLLPFFGQHKLLCNNGTGKNCLELKIFLARSLSVFLLLLVSIYPCNKIQTYQVRYYFVGKGSFYNCLIFRVCSGIICVILLKVKHHWTFYWSMAYTAPTVSRKYNHVLLVPVWTYLILWLKSLQIHKKLSN